MTTLGRRRALGQHFLKDRSIARKIAETALELLRSTASRALLEIGPGQGAITEPILELAATGDPGAIPSRFILCERDPSIARRWSERSARETRLKMLALERDFLELPEDQWLSERPLTVVSNLPYSAATAILLRLAAKTEQIPAMVLMFQAEVARRLRASKSTKEWGSLSIWIQNHWEVTLLCAVPPGAFSPPPQVQSEVVVLRRRLKSRIEIGETDLPHWEGLLKAAFAHRRKMLRSGLPPSSAYRKALEVSGVDGTKRAEALDWEEWGRLWQALVRLKRA